ncbi:MAG: TRAP transporter large permease subunit [Alphaproteobacteria bacterium]|nr:TRAP transporter large permease subunit [Alphaproteobacteria bacterium]
MDWAVSLGVLLGSLLLTLATGLPVAIAFFGLSVVGLIVVLGPVALTLLAAGAFGSVAQFVFIAVPLFVLMGEILMRSGIAAMTIDAADKWIGRVPARLSVSTVAGGAVFATLSGSSMAAVAVFGSTMLPEMQRKRYAPEFAVGSVLAAGGLAVLIPPSGLAVLLGALAKVSIAKLLIAIVVPGFLLAALYALYFVGRAALQPHLAPPEETTSISWRERGKTLWLLIPLSLLILIVTGFIFLGLATPSEAAAMGAIASAILAAAYGRFSWPILRESLMATVATSSMVLLIIAGSTAFSQILAATGATSKFAAMAAGLPVAPWIIVVGMQAVMFVLGCFIDGVSIMLITLPIFMPVAAALGLDPIWLCVLFMIQLELGGITPPFGLSLFVLKGVRPEIDVRDIYRSVIPVVLIQIILSALVMSFPALATWLPQLMIR